MNDEGSSQARTDARADVRDTGRDAGRETADSAVAEDLTGTAAFDAGAGDMPS